MVASVGHAIRLVILRASARVFQPDRPQPCAFLVPSRAFLHVQEQVHRAFQQPAELVPGTLSVLTARMDYLPQDTPGDWQAWYELGVASDGIARSRAFARAAALNPVGEDIAVLRERGQLPGGPR